MIMPIEVDGQRGIVIARGEQAKPPSWTGPILVLVCGLLILVIGPIIMARWIVRPIQQLSKTASALGTGDLAARAGLERTDEIGELGHAVRRDGRPHHRPHALGEGAVRQRRSRAADAARAHRRRARSRRPRGRRCRAQLALGDRRRPHRARSDRRRHPRPCGSSSRHGTAGQLPIRYQSVEPQTIVDAAISRQTSRHPGRAIANELPADLPPIEVDPMLVRRVLDNLLENAHKYTTDPSATTRVAARRSGDHDRVRGHRSRHRDLR